MKYIRLILVMIIVGSLVACSKNIKEVTYDSKINDKVSESDNLTKNEKKLFGSAITYAKEHN
ncbi:hypothetical protein V7266_30655, partial [Neobacillus drentensis]|uniref:hypothetical protein n=1 Tax=Neobacillus drentensis TaxID=220684 RepID=UPI002FFFE4DD